ncbi:hypothetical protein [Mucilaginibacter agri]|uniref:Uncharacterized protein n=1 Tax=Mucilaginibacter agri TaxID=2695265 RepID=A0A965ZJ06_9SPHI|nr:hypothetical protein [Mucilaginibacter agri]NCD70962.1 hypothetical protein [Mucilaginibacter agri]
MAQKHTFEIQSVINGSKPVEELVILTATGNINTKGFALVDRTFDEDGKVSNEFRHIFVFPSLEVKAGERVVVCTAKGKSGPKTLDNGEKIHALYWGSDDCVWNDNGGDTATLINFVQVNSKIVPPVKKKKG